MNSSEWNRDTQVICHVDLRLRVRHFLLDSPLIGDAYLRWRRGYAAQVPTRDTQITIDGFPRSANSYAWYAFQVANGGDGLRGHTHSSRSLLRSCQLGIPSVLLLREPRACISSYMQHQAGSDFRSVCSAYKRYHTRLRPVADELVIAPFEVVTSDFGRVVDEVNSRFGTKFVRYRTTEANEAEVTRRIEESLLRFNNGAFLESMVARPSPSRVPAGVIFGRLSRRDQQQLADVTALWEELRSRNRVTGGGCD